MLGPRVGPGSVLGGHGNQRVWMSGVEVWSRRTPKITRLPPRDFDVPKRPIGNSGALLCSSVLWTRDQFFGFFERDSKRGCGEYGTWVSNQLFDIFHGSINVASLRGDNDCVGATVNL